MVIFRPPDNRQKKMRRYIEDDGCMFECQFVKKYYYEQTIIIKCIVFLEGSIFYTRLIDLQIFNYVILYSL